MYVDGLTINAAPGMIGVRSSDAENEVDAVATTPKERMGNKSKKQLLLVAALVVAVLVLCVGINAALSANQRAQEQQQAAEQQALADQAAAEQREAEAQAEAKRQEQERIHQQNLTTVNSYVGKDARVAQQELEAKGFVVSCVAYVSGEAVLLEDDGQDWVVMEADLGTNEAQAVTLSIDTAENIAAREAEAEAAAAEAVAAEAERKRQEEEREAAAQAEAAAAEAAAANDKANTTVYITDTGAKYHRDGCRHISQSKIPISLGDAVSQGYEPCKTCNPPTL
ncbi:MAG: hypothetical protein LBI64_00065 [Coriobacteriales bacterium]|jgi:hypothetical protein|nr:hypothetical protein [Coriobacteriales bacterium]